jgi:uncharacterized membrane protein
MSLARRLMGPAFILTGTLHFVRPREYEAIMPPYVPAHREMVAISGAGEIIGGVAALFPRTHPFARFWLIALLVAVFPANVHMALNPDDIRGLPDIPRWLLWARLPLQAVFIAWVIHATREG